MYILPVEVTNGSFSRTKDFIMTSLGDPFLSVHLAEKHMNYAIEEAIGRFYENMDQSFQYMVVDYWQFETEPTQSLYRLPDCIDPGKIKAVIYTPNNYPFFNIAFNQNYDYLYFLNTEYAPDLTTFYLAMMRQEFVNHVLGQEGTWDIVGSPPCLHLMPTPNRNVPAAVMFTKLADEHTLERISWIREYALARSKVYFGEILTRFSNIPGGMGGDIQMNGADLKQEGKEELEKLMEELRLNCVFSIHTDSE
jgi:hypothetical protein